jgi:tripartite-type tricarboxylate transporter receptor subunit TctC
VLVVNPVPPMQSVSDLVKLAKEKPGQLTYGTPGGGTFQHLNAEMFKRAFGLDIIHVPYKGTRAGLDDLIAGHVTMMFTDMPPALPLIAAGKLRALGVTTAERVPAAPDIPPLAEAGMAGYDTASWHMVVAPGQVANEIVERLNGEIRSIMSDPLVQRDLIRDGAIPQVTPSPDALKEFVKTEIARWGRLVQQAGLAGSQ